MDTEALFWMTRRERCTKEGKNTCGAEGLTILLSHIIVQVGRGGAIRKGYLLVS